MRIPEHPTRAVVLFAALAAFLAGCSKPAPASPQTGGGPTRIRFKTDWYPQAEHGGFYQALAKGFYREAGSTWTSSPGVPACLCPS